MAMKTYKFKLRLTQAETAKVTNTLNLCRQLYNCSLEQRKNNHKQAKSQGIKNPTSKYYQQKQLPELRQELPEYKTVNSQVLQNTIARVDKTYQSFFKHVKSGKGKGFPRFKSQSRYNSFTHPQATNCDFDWGNSLLRFPGLDWLRFWPDPRIGTPEGPDAALAAGGIPKTCTIIREPDDWYFCLVIEMPAGARPNPLETSDLSKLRIGGIDVGLKARVITSDNQELGNLKTIKLTERKIRLIQQKLSKSKKGSNRRKKILGTLRKQHSRLARTRKQQDYVVTKELLSQFDVVGVEDLNIKGMLSRDNKAAGISASARKGIRRNLGLAGLGSLIQTLTYKAESAGKLVVKVNPKGTTQQCSACAGYPATRITLRSRVYRCEHCGFEGDRDWNAAMNIRARAIAELSSKPMNVKNKTGCLTPTVIGQETLRLVTAEGVDCCTSVSLQESSCEAVVNYLVSK